MDKMNRRGHSAYQQFQQDLEAKKACWSTHLSHIFQSQPYQTDVLALSVLQVHFSKGSQIKSRSKDFT